MRILYGVVGEGMGHATRSRVVLDHLVDAGHEVQIVVSGRAHDYLQKHFEGVNHIWGLQFVYADNEVKNVRSLLVNLKGALKGLPHNIRRYFDLTEKFEPEAVVTDFETWSYLYGKNHFLPVFCLDNIQILNRCAHPRSVARGYEKEFRLAKSFVKAKLPGCAHYLITTFFWPKTAKARTSLYPPVLRPEVLAAKPRRGEHLLVYQTSPSNKALVEVLRRSGVPCRVYGMRREIPADQVEGNLTYRPFSEAGFIDDLRTARGVLSNGGFTLLSECVYLHKPVLAVPVGNQFEQIMNARYIEHLGYGKFAAAMTADVLQSFLASVPEHERALARHRQDGNRQILAALDGLLDSVAARSRPRTARA